MTPADGGAAEPPIYITVGFKCSDQEAFDAFWQDIRTRYHWMSDKPWIGTQAFAVSKGDMFAEQQAIDALCDDDMDPDALREAIGRVPCCDDLKALLAEYEVEFDR
jgi:hypothetical protein